MRGRGWGGFALTPGSALLLLIVALAAALRLTNLGYAEFQGDEARAMLMASGLGEGRDDVLWVHKKGPGEALMPALLWAAVGGIDEGTARLPFAVANLTAALALAALAGAMTEGRTQKAEDRERSGDVSSRPTTFRLLPSVVAALILVLDGYFQAFARIVQYQSLVALMSVLGVWCAWRAYRSEGHRWAALGAACIAVGTLAHYEAIFALPPLAVLVWRRVAPGLRPADIGRGLRALVGPGLAFGAVAAFFYLPFALHPHFAETIRYIVDRRVGVGSGSRGPLYNNLYDYFARATFYNSTWWIALLILALVAGVIYATWRFEIREWRGAGWIKGIVAVWPAVAVVGAAFAPQMLEVRQISLAIVLFLPWLAWALAPRLPDAFKAALVWFLGPFLVAAFLVQKPVTHFYTMMPGLALVIALAAGYWIGSRQGLWQRRDVIYHVSTRFVSTALLLIVTLLQINYLWTVFVRHDPEYKRVFPAARSPLYPAVYGDKPPSGYFGFPYRAGWGVVTALYADGTLRGDYGSNEEPLITGWYTRGVPRCRTDPRYYVIAENVQDAEKVPLGKIEREYHLLAQVDDGGWAKLRVFSREPVQNVRRFDLADSFHLAPNPQPAFPIGQALEADVPATATDATFEGMRLVGYELPRRTVLPGQPVQVTLFWRAETPPGRDLTVFSHVEDNKIWGQHDSWLACNDAPMSTLAPGQLVVEARSLWLDPATPPGDYPLRVGLYDVNTGQRVPAAGVDTAIDQAILGLIHVPSPREAAQR